MNKALPPAAGLEELGLMRICASEGTHYGSARTMLEFCMQREVNFMLNG